MVKPTTHLVLAVALLLLSGIVAAQGLDEGPGVSPESSDLGEGVIAYNFVMQGLPGEAVESSNAGEVDFERSFETEEDENESYSTTEEEALETAREELNSSEWQLEESDRSEGLYEFEFVRGESEAKVVVDGSSGEIIEFEAEVEWEPGNSEPSAVLSGFIQFSSLGYEVDSDVEVDEESNQVNFEVVIENDDEIGADQVNRKSVRESEEVEPGSYTAILEVVRDDEVVHTEEKEIRVPGASEDENETEDNLENMSRDELIEEIRDLREEVERLREEISGDSEDDSGLEEGPGLPDDTDPEDDEEEENESDESEEEETENSQDSSEQGPPEAAPGNSENRPGFVNRLLSGLFG